jgi:hypothetical protein
VAAVTTIEHAQSGLPLNAHGRFPGHVSGSLRGRARSRNLPDPTVPHRGRPPGSGAARAPPQK